MSIKIESKIATGSSGSIFKIINQKNGTKEYQALKVSPNQRGIIKNPLEIILHYTNCPYLINSIDYEIDHNVKKIYMPLGICNITKIYRYKVDIVKIMFQICLGVRYLHSLNIVHGDIKPSNILLFKDKKEGYIAKLSDFNLSYICLNKIKGIPAYTNGYKPPEILDSNEYDLSSDIWALGQTFKKISSLNEYDINKSQFNEMIKNMIEINPLKRWNINQVLDSDFFKPYITTELEDFKSYESYDYTKLFENCREYFEKCINLNIEEFRKIILKLFGCYIFNEINNIDFEILCLKILITFFQIHIFKSI